MQADLKPLPIVEVIGLKKRYGLIQALKGISFSVGKGEIVGFLGPNGAGKSTTLKILSGLIPADSGEGLGDHSRAHRVLQTDGAFQKAGQ